jgi:SAM-dependent methyltransferase
VRTEPKHRTDYRQIPSGRDAYIVRAIGPWIESTLGRLIRESASVPARIIDIGCGEQPLRRVVEENGGTYFCLDVEQNSTASVDVLAFIDRELPSPWPDTSQMYDVVLCTEVLEHVSDWNAAFRNLRRLTAPGGSVLITCPFVFPLHMEPVDYFRSTPYSIQQFAESHDFSISEFHRLGGPRDVLSTLLDDASILPNEPKIRARLTARAMRLARRLLVRLLQHDKTWTYVQVNSNVYLSNAVVLKPR